MLPVRVILHPTDFSERAQSAFSMACALARDYGSRLIVLHVASPPAIAFGDMILAPAPEVNYQELKDKLLGLQGPDAGLHVEHRLEEGAPAEEILRVAHESKCDLIVMGTHGRKGIGRLLLGSVAEQVMRNASCPVVTLKTPFPAAAPGPRSPVMEKVTK